METITHSYGNNYCTSNNRNIKYMYIKSVLQDLKKKQFHWKRMSKLGGDVHAVALLSKEFQVTWNNT